MAEFGALVRPINFTYAVQNEVVVTGRGQNDLLRVPTPDGVREPQNRRVEIVEGNSPPPTSMR